jgi:hypothetical protein
MRFLKVLAGLATLGLGVGFAFLVGWWVAANPVAQYLLILLVVFVIAIVAFALGGAWRGKAMRDGADVALKAQGYNDAWDARKTTAMAALFREGARIGGRLIERQQRDMPALPMPSQQTADDWLPELTEFGADRSEPDPEIWGAVIDGGDGHAD